MGKNDLVYVSESFQQILMQFELWHYLYMSITICKFHSLRFV
jgi:hypothetical protein